MIEAKVSTSPISRNRSPLTSHLGTMTSLIVWSGSTGPLQVRRYVFQRQDGTPGPACTIAFGANRANDRSLTCRG